jgi:hypothetical protein
MSKKLTIAQLLERKESLKQRTQRKQTLYVESLDAEIVIQEPSRSLAIEGLEMTQDAATSEQADLHLVYHCVIEPNLKDAELQKAYCCAEPTDIVAALFLPGEIGAISGFALQLAGYGGKGVTKVDAELKK